MNSTEVFEKERPRLLKIAYSMLGRFSEAQDIVQEAFLKWDKVNHNDIHSPSSYLTTIISRLCLDQLKSAHSRREQYMGPWLPEPIVTSGWQVPDSYSELAESLTIAFLHTLEQLNPVQRAVFLLHDIFGYTFKEIAEILDKTPASCRKMAQRARSDLRIQGTGIIQADARQEEKVKQFVRAIQAGDMQQIEKMLTRDAILYSDGGGEAAAVPKPIIGSHKIGRFLNTISAKAPAGKEVRFARVNNTPGVVTLRNGILTGIWAFHINNDLIQYIYVVRNPHKMNHLAEWKSSLR